MTRVSKARWGIRVVSFAFFLCPVFASAQGQAPGVGVPILEGSGEPAEADVESILVGAWTVQVANQERARTLQVRGIKAAGGQFQAESAYGWSDGKLQPVSMAVTVENGVVAVDLATPAASRIEATSVGPDRFDGFMTTKDGKRLKTVLTFAGKTDEKLAAGARAKEITLIYVGAWNCPTCLRWEGADGDAPVSSKKSFLATPEAKAAKFRQISAPQFQDTAYDKAWPDDLKWVKEKTYVARGTPRYVLIADGKVVANSFGTRSLVQTIMPKIRQLAGLP